MAYASIASLMRMIELLLTSKSPMQSLICDHKEEFLALQGKVSSLEVFLKNFEKSNDTEKMAYLEAQIKDVTNAVEHTIQLRLTEAVMADDEMQKEREDKRLFDSLKQVAEEIDHVQNGSSNFQDYDTVSCYHRIWLLEKLTQYDGSSRKLKVISIAGMGGIGKTTLAKEVYDYESIRSHYDVRAWTTVSQQYNVKDILKSLLHSTIPDRFDLGNESRLAYMLGKSLKSKRYLIVLDDVWSFKAWDDVRQCIPSNNNGSRILLTTRNKEVAYYAGTKNLSLCMDLMDQDESWNLAKSIMFANEALPYDFETIGKQVVVYCQGLPLAIAVISALLSRSKRTIEDWENIAEDVMSLVTEDPYERYLHVLGVSYNHLTSDLKACLLYFGIFPEDSEISVKSLVRFWMAEGFLKSEKDLEKEAEKYLQDLIDRHLVLVGKKSFDGTKIRSCKVHNLIHELCVRELAQSQDIFVMKDIVFDKSYEDDDLDEGDDSGGDGDSDAKEAQSHAFSPECHNFSTHKMQPFKRWTDDRMCLALLTPEHDHMISRQTDDDDYTLLKRTRSIFSFCLNSTFTLHSELIHFSLLRILDLGTTKLRSFPPHVLCLIWLRYLALSGIGGDFYVPPEICRLWNLQTLIVKWGSPRYVAFTEKIWELMQLRQLRLRKFYLSNPPRESDDEESYLAFSNIHAISGLSPSSCTKEVISGIRNVKKLAIYGHANDYKIFQESRLLDNFVHLHQLETLSFELDRRWDSSENCRISPATIPSAKAFPVSLRKLKLEATAIRWEDLNIIGELPNLEVLKLMRNACIGEEWYPIEGRFTRLKLLLIENCDLKYWKATDDNFCVLERLLIRHCYSLEEIPIKLAYIFSLQLIELTGCTTKLEASAVQIQEEQENLVTNPWMSAYDLSITLVVVPAQCGRGRRHKPKYGFGRTQ
ncbi:putative late blight resistance protein homolog R1A-3 [Nicotiana sylvestris]|uniref:putative late blight resistance protein homolog R1A-3 n=1 Tax=Nicotiana sylvestris TaxID=4096 RepID=UPI00388C5888